MTHQNEPEFIPETRDFTLLVNLAKETYNKNIQHSHLNMGASLLKACLYHMYGSTDVTKLIEKSTNINECELFNKTILYLLEKNKWCRSSSYIALSNLKKILTLTVIDPVFTQKLSLVNPSSKDTILFLLPKKYRTERVKAKVQKIMAELSTECYMKSTASLRVFFYFIFNTFLARMYGINPEYDDFSSINTDTLKTKIIEYNLPPTKVKWITLFLRVNNIPYNKDIDKIKCFPKSVLPKETGDKHWIRPDELDKIYQAAKTVKEKLIFLLFISTGMRVSGMVNIKLEHVATKTDSGFMIRDNGRTIEKGNKWFTFMIIPEVQTLLYDWIMNIRKSNSIYLFPSRNYSDKPISPTTISKLFKTLTTRAGLTGSHLHLHSLRHSYAHMLLESGNNVDVVSKLLNHATSKTTEQYYLRESALDVAKRANVPWLDSSNKPTKIIPDFLNNTNRDKQPTMASMNSRKKERKNMIKLDRFTQPPTVPLFN